MKTDNELIAEFMGLKSISKKEFEKCPEKYSIETESIIEYQRYHVDWNWLMPVVEKIESLPIIRDVTINITGCSIYFKGGVTSAHEITKLSSVYMSVITFIKWYNQQPK